MNKRKWTAMFAAMGMLLLIADGETALSGAREGIQMCLYTVIPALLPFFVLSGCLTGELAGTGIPFLRPLGRLCGMPPGSESVLLIGFLGGYPTGARSVYQLWSQGQVGTNQAKRMLGFCSNAGPSFLFGICAGLFPSLRYAWLLWLIHILSALFVAAVLPGKQGVEKVRITGRSPGITDVLRQALTAIASVCGWVVLFRIVLGFLGEWLPLKDGSLPSVVYSGALELTNGCILLGEITGIGTRFLLCGAFLAFGGVCVVLQTVSVTGGLGLGWYLPGKLLQTVMSVFLCTITAFFLFPPQERVPYSGWLLLLSGSVMLIFLLFFKKRRNGSSISGESDV